MSEVPFIVWVKAALKRGGTHVYAVLLVPHESDPHGLLAEGPCGARPPIAYDVSGTGPGSGWRTDTWAKTVRFKRRALVLAWNGDLVAEGACRVRGMPESWVSAMLDGGMDAHDWETWVCSWGHIGTLILLDADGREAAP